MLAFYLENCIIQSIVISIMLTAIHMVFFIHTVDGSDMAIPSFTQCYAYIT
jgi:hypothetical protein